MKSVLSKLLTKPCSASQMFKTVACVLTSRGYCNDRPIHQWHKEGKKSRSVYGQAYPVWRKPWIERNSKLAVFDDKTRPEILHTLQKIPNMDLQGIKDWWKDIKTYQEIDNQKYLPERVAILGSNLAAIHFFTYRQAAVRLRDSNDWIAGTISKLSDELPHTFEEGYYVEAIDCSSFQHGGIRYEGLKNLAGLNYLKWLSLKNQIHIDTWCLDRIAGETGNTLEYLDISSCNLDVGCVYALARMPKLCKLVVKDPGDSTEIQAALSFLEYCIPTLIIQAVDDNNVAIHKRC